MAKKAFLIFLAAAALGGCIKDDRSDCPDDAANLILDFEYFDTEGKDIFADRIDMVDLIIFDQNKNFYAWIPIDDADLQEYRGYSLAVEPGDYYIVSWANNRSTSGGSSTPDASFIYHSNPETADPLHYAPDKRFLGTDEGTRTRSLEEGTWKVTVTPKGVTRDTLGFMSAHRTVNVYLKDFPFSPDAASYPQVSIENLAEYYDFTLSRGPETAYFVQTSYEIDIEGQSYCFARFYIPHFDNDNNVNVIIKGEGAYDYSHTIGMDEILDLHGITEVYDGDDLVLDVEVSWGDGTFVQIAIPPFTVKDVGGAFD